MESPAFRPDRNGTEGLENPSFQDFELADQDSSAGDKNSVVRNRKPELDSVITPSPNGDLPGGNNNSRKGRGGGNILSKVIEGSRNALGNFIEKNKVIVKRLFLLGLFVGYNAYVATAVAYAVRHEANIAWCDGLGFLIILTGILWWSLFYYVVLKGYFGETINEAVLKPLGAMLKSIFARRWVGICVGLLAVAGLVTFVIIDTWGEPRRLISACGGVILLLITLILSKHPGDVKWRQVFAGLGLQFVFALAVLRWDGGRNFLECISRKVTAFLTFADSGSSFIYDFTASGNLTVFGTNIEASEMLKELKWILVPTTFAFTSLSVIFFFSFVVQLLYHIGAMLWVVRKVGWLLQMLVGTSAAESMNAAANIFLGQTEAPLLIKPFMDDLTKSELHAVMTGGFATIAGTVMAAYISFGVKAESLLSASVMAAPCALALSKLMYPEIEESRTSHKQIKNADTKTEGNALDAAAKGASEAVGLVWNILANILAFVSFIAMLNAIINWFGVLVGLNDLSFEWLLGKIFIPVALCIGVDPSEANEVARVLGLKIVVNEFVAYKELQGIEGLSERSRRLAEYALCGFANFSSMGIQLGGLGSIAPNRRPDLADIVWRALFAGATASLINACVAGTLMSFDDEAVTNDPTATTPIFSNSLVI